MCPPDTCIEMGSSPIPLPNKKGEALTSPFLFGAGDRTRTGTLSPAVDFESTTSTIPSHRQKLDPAYIYGRLSGCGARYLPRLSKAVVSYRPLPIAQVASSATGGAPIAPHHTGRCLDSIHQDLGNIKWKISNKRGKAKHILSFPGFGGIMQKNPRRENHVY